MPNPYRSAAAAAEVHAWCTARLDRWDVPHEQHLVATDLGDAHLVSVGNGSDVCMYLPGTNFTAATSQGLLTSLATRLRVYAADLPGQPGLSAAARPKHELAGYGRWVAEVLRWIRSRYPGSRLVLAGHSRGAAVALLAPPEDVDAVALLSPAGFLRARPSPAMLRAAIPWMLQGGDDASRRLLTYMSGPGHTPSPDHVEWMTLLARTTRTTGAPGPLPARSLSGWRDSNVGLLVGQYDAFFPPGRLAPAARSALDRDPVAVSGAGHLVTDEEPDVVRDFVVTLLAPNSAA